MVVRDAGVGSRAGHGRDRRANGRPDVPNLPPRRTPAGSTILFLTNQLGGAFGIALLAGIIRLGSDDGAWTPAVGTAPLLLPTAAAVAIAVVAIRLPARGD